MSSMMIGLIAIVVGGVILNFASAGMVAGFYFWRGIRDVTKLALIGAGATSFLMLAMMSGAFFQGELMQGEQGIAMVVGMVMLVGIAFAATLPGAFIMSRKIAKADPFGDTFR